MINNCTTNNIINLVIKIAFPVFVGIILLTLFVPYREYKKGNLSVNKYYNKVLLKMFLCILILSVPIILYKKVKPSFLFICAIEEQKRNNAEEIKQEIVMLKNSLSVSDCETIKNKIANIEDAEVKKELERELASIENYITMNATIDSLKKEFILKDYYNTYKEIEKISDSAIKDKLYSNIMSLGKDKPLDVDSGYTLETTNGTSYYFKVPLHPLENMPLVIVMQAYDCHEDLGVNSYKYTDKEFFYMDPYNIGAYNDSILKNFKTVIDEVVEKYKISRNKIIITGHSNGALSTMKMVSFFPNYFAAAVPISSVMQNFSGDPYVNTAFWGICGTGESCATTMQTYANRINNKGGTAKASTFPGGHTDTACVFLEKEVLEWALSQEKK